MLKINTLCAILALAAAPLVVADELSDSGEFIDGVAAIVNEGVVLKSQFVKEVERVKQGAAQQGMQLPPEDVLHEQLLERLIVTELQLQRADQRGVTAEISDQYVNASIQRIAEQNGVQFAEMPALLASDGVDYAEFREDLRKELTLDRLKNIEVLRSIRVSEREISQCVIDLETNVVVNSDWALSHILLSIPESADTSQAQEIQDLADDIYQRLQDNADFRELAARYSDGSTALEGGSLGAMQGSEVPSIFSDVLPGMKTGDVSKPFRTSNSLHIVKVDQLRSAVERSEISQAKIRHILVSPNEIIDDATAKQKLETALEKIRGGEDFGEQAKLLSDDPGSGNLGGDLGWMETDAFAPAFQAQADEAEIGVITEPFRSQFGWHILEVLDRRMYDNTEELKERNCKLRIRAGKQEEETLLWLQRMRDEAFVDIRV